MSAYTGDIVKDGLVLCLDAGNIKSYSGTGTAWNDMSGQRNNAVLTNGPTYTALNKGAIILDGSNDCAVVNGNAAILSKTAYTKIAWFYVTSFSTANNIISGGNGAEHAFWMASTNKLNAGHNGSWSTIVGNTTLSLNTWYFGAVTYNSTTGWVLYLNGVQDATNGTTTTFNGTQEVLIGGYGTGTNPFTGRISYALVYNRVLSAAEVRENYNATKGRYDTTRSSDAIKPRLSTSGLVLHLDAANYRSFVSGSSTWRDLSGNNNNAVLTNGPTYSSESGGCIVFDGNNDYGIVSNSSTLNMGGKSFTADIWIAVSTTSGTERMILEYNVWPNQGTYQVTTQPNQIVVNFIDANGAGKALYHSIPTFTNGAWTNVVGQFDTINNTISLYINGSRVAQNTAVTQEIGNAVSNLYICSRGGGSLFLPCKMASVKMYDRALSADEISQHFNYTKVRYGYVL